MAEGIMTAHTQYELSEIENAVTYFRGKESPLQDLYREVSNMGSLGLMWDIKVPEKEKGIFNFMKFSDDGGTHRESVLTALARYKEFFCDVKKALALIEKRSVDGDKLVNDLYDKLNRLEIEAKSGMEVTRSSILLRVHGDFASNIKEMEGEIKRIECIVTRKKLKTALKGWDEAKKEIKHLKKKVDDVLTSNRGLTERVDRLVTMLERVSLPGLED